MDEFVRNVRGWRARTDGIVSEAAIARRVNQKVVSGRVLGEASQAWKPMGTD